MDWGQSERENQCLNSTRVVTEVWSKTGQLKGEHCVRGCLMSQQQLRLRLREHSCIFKSLGFWKDAGDLRLSQLLCLAFYFLRNPVLDSCEAKQLTFLPGVFVSFLNERPQILDKCKDPQFLIRRAPTEVFTWSEVLAASIKRILSLHHIAESPEGLPHHGAMASSVCFLENILVSFVVTVSVRFTSPNANERFSNCVLREVS